MKNLVLFSLTVLTISITQYNEAHAQSEATLRCEYQTGYGEASFYIGYDFNLKTRNFENRVTLSVGPLDPVGDQSFTFIEATGKGAITFENGYALLTHSNLQNPVPFVLKCQQLDPEAVTIETRDFEILSEDVIDGEIKPNLNFMNYCGNDTAILQLDLSKYLEKSSPWYNSKFSLFAERSQFGPSFDCLPGERRRENFKVLNQILNEARSHKNILKGQIRIRKQKFAPSGYAVKLELQSENLNRTFIFRDSLGAGYEQ